MPVINERKPNVVVPDVETLNPKYAVVVSKKSVRWRESEKRLILSENFTRFLVIYLYRSLSLPNMRSGYEKFKSWVSKILGYIWDLKRITKGQALRTIMLSLAIVSHFSPAMFSGALAQGIHFVGILR
ncbi:MAG: hypothetical protein OD815_001358 [Candidatus Alkanophagales archaeon MCA70_species_2]|nr:hypothetical protein [Candidatus Alkanophaga liquidiphilum]